MVLSMPNKEKLKNPSANPRKKPKYKVTNWTNYNKILRKRVAISLYFPKGDADIRNVFNASDEGEAKRLLALAVTKYESKESKVSAWMEENIPQSFSVF